MKSIVNNLDISVQSTLLLKLSALPILLPTTCFKAKSNLDKYNDHLAYLQFNF